MFTGYHYALGYIFFSAVHIQCREIKEYLHANVLICSIKRMDDFLAYFLFYKCNCFILLIILLSILVLGLVN